jgi:Transglycosylase SLT domain
MTESAGAVSVDVLPDFTGFGPRLRAGLAEAIRSASRGVDAEVGVDLDSSGLRGEVTRATKEAGVGQSVKVGVDVDTSSARGLDTALGRVVRNAARRNKIKLGFDTPDVGSILPLQFVVGKLATVATVAAPALFALSSSALQAGASLAAMIPAAIGAAATVGTLIAAFAGVAGTLKNYIAAQKSAVTASGNTAAAELSNARAIRNGQQAIADARRQQARVAEQSAETIRSAEIRVADAQANARQAQQQLNDARREAVQQLRDLKEQVSDLALDEEGARIRVLRAQQELAKQNRNLFASDLDRREAAYELATAQDHLKDVQRDRVKGEKDLAAATRKGVEGSAVVVKARDELTAARRAQSEAERDLTVARRDAGRAQEDAARAVAQAVLALSDVQAQQAAASDKASSANLLYADSYRKLTPAGKAFFDELVVTLPLLHQLQATGETATLPGFTRFLRSARGLFPTVNRSVKVFGGVMSDAADSAGRLVRTPAFRRDFATILDSMGRAFGSIGRTVTPLARILTALGVATSPLVERFAAFVEKETTLFADFLEGKQRTGELTRFFQAAGDEMATWGTIVGNFGTGLLNLFRDANPAGRTLAERLKTVSEKFKAWTGSADASDKIRRFFKFFADLDYGKLASIAVTAAKMAATFSLFRTAGVIAKNPFWFLLALTTVEHPEAAGKLVDGVWRVASPMLTFLADHPNVFAGFVAFLGALRLAASAKGIGGLLTGLAGAAGVSGAGGVAGVRDVKSRRPGSPFNPIVTVGGGGEGVDLHGGKGKGGKGGGGVLAAGGRLGIIGAIVFGANELLKATTGNDLVHALSWTGIKETFRPLTDFLGTTLPGWARKGWQAVEWTFGGGLKRVILNTAAFQGVSHFFTQTIPGWAGAGWGLVKKLWEGPHAPLTLGGLRFTFSPVTGFFGRTIPGWAGGSWNTVKHVWEVIKARLSATGVTGAFGSIKDFLLVTVPGWGAKGVDLLGKAWDKIKEKMAGPTRTIVDTIYNHGIRAVWNTLVSKLPGVGDLPELKIKGINAATGAVLPGYTPGRDVHTFVSPTGGFLNLSGGEAVMRPEFTRAVGKGWIGAANDAATRAGVRGVRRFLGNFDDGGIIGDIVRRGRAVLGAGVHKIQDLGRAGAARGLEIAFGPIKNLIHTLMGTAEDFRGVLGKLAQWPLDRLVAKVRGNEEGAFQGGFTVGGGVEQWRAVALQALALARAPASWIGSLLRRMNQESGGNPNAINLWDFNARAGIPSQGLMQVIPPTFARWAGDLFRRGIRDPLANIYAAIRYTIATYGSGPAGWNRSGGYDYGGWLMPGQTLVDNRTGRPEAVLNASQWDAVERLAVGGGTTVHVHNPPSRTTERQVVAALDRRDLLASLARPALP